MNKVVIATVLGTVVSASNIYVAFSISAVKVQVQEVQGQVIDLTEKVQQISTYKSTHITKFTAVEQECLAKNIFYEAGVESFYGKIAVAQVTNNRLITGRWGQDVCSVVHAKSQFSWTLDKKKRRTKPTGPLWDKSVAAAAAFQQGTRINNLENSKFYHTNYIRTPYWADSNKKVLTVGQHIFYTAAKKI